MSDWLCNMSPAARERNKDLLEFKVAQTLKERKGRLEGEFQDALIAYAEARGWLVYHTHDSRWSQSGFPDLVMLRENRIVIAELKAGSNTTTPEQDRWPRAWLDAGSQVSVWRAGEGDGLEIERVLL